MRFGSYYQATFPIIPFNKNFPGSEEKSSQIIGAPVVVEEQVPGSWGSCSYIPPTSQPFPLFQPLFFLAAFILGFPHLPYINVNGRLVTPPGHVFWLIQGTADNAKCCSSCHGYCLHLNLYLLREQLRYQMKNTSQTMQSLQELKGKRGMVCLYSADIVEFLESASLCVITVCNYRYCGMILGFISILAEALYF